MNTAPTIQELDPFAGLSTTQAPTVPTAGTPNPPSAKQVEFAVSLKRECCELEGTDFDEAEMRRKLAETDRRVVSKKIDATVQRRNELRAQAKAEGRTAKGDPPEGFHVLDDQVFKVQRAVHGSSNLYAKRLLLEHADELRGREGKLEWEYVGRRGAFQRLSEATLLTREKAVELGHLYGVCCRCGATLTREESIERGMGPVCFNKWEV